MQRGLIPLMRFPAHERHSMKMTHPVLPARHPLFTLCLLASLQACAVSTPYRTPVVSVPAQWQNGEGLMTNNALPTAWWLQQDDNVLANLIDQVLARNGELAVAALRVGQAQLGAELIGSQRLPGVTAGVSASASRLLETNAHSTHAGGINVGVTEAPDLWRRVASAAQSAQRSAEALDEDRQSLALQLVETTATLYWNIAWLNQSLDLSEQNLAHARQTLALVRIQRKLGAVAGLEEAQAGQQLDTLQVSRTELLQLRTEQRLALALLLDGPPELVVPESPQLPATDPATLAPDLPASVLARRPDVRAAELRLRAALSSSDATRASFYPTLNLTAGIGTSGDQLSRWLSNPVATLGASVVLPFVHWRDMQRSIAISQSDYEQAAIGFRTVLYRALSEAETALSSMQSLQQQAASLQRVMDASQRAERLSEVQYRVGAVPLKSWLDAQQARRNVEDSLIRNRRDQWVNRAGFYRVLGGSVAPLS